MSSPRNIGKPLAPSIDEAREPRALERAPTLTFSNKDTATLPLSTSASAARVRAAVGRQQRAQEPPSQDAPREQNDLEQRRDSITEPPRAYRIRRVCEISDLGRTSIYAAIKSGALVARKWNRCTIVLAEDLAAFLRNLPTTR